MSGLYKINKFLAVWIALPIFFSYSTYFFPLSVKALLSPVFMTSFSVLLYTMFVFLLKPRFNFVPELQILIAFFAILVIGLVYTSAIGYGIEKITILYAWIIVFYLYGFIVVNNFDLFVKASLFAGLLFIFFLFLNFGDPISFFKSMQGNTVRLGAAEEGTNEYYLNPIWVARYLGLLFLLALYSMHKGRRNYFTYAYLLCIFLYMITSGSKGPIVALIGACAIFFADSKLAGNIRNLFIFIVIAVGLIILLNFIDFFSSSFFISRFSSGSSSSSDREELIGKAIEYRGILSFFFGSGTGDFGFLITKGDNRLYPHNILAELYCENGIVGVFILLSMFYSIIRKYALILRHRSLRMITAIFFYFGLNTMFSGDLSSNNYFFIFFILVHYEAKMLSKEEELAAMMQSEDSMEELV